MTHSQAHGGEGMLLDQLDELGLACDANTQLVVVCEVCSRPATKDCWTCGMKICDFCTLKRHWKVPRSFMISHNIANLCCLMLVPLLSPMFASQMHNRGGIKRVDGPLRRMRSRCIGHLSTQTTCGRSSQGASWRRSALRTHTGAKSHKNCCVRWRRLANCRCSTEFGCGDIPGAEAAHQMALTTLSFMQAGGEGPELSRRAAAAGDAQLPGCRLQDGSQA